MMRPWSASERGRQRLVEPWTLAVIMVVIAALLVIVFPRKLLIQQRDYAGEATAISVAYLQALLRSQPDATNVRINLVRQLLELGQLDAARKALEPLENSSADLGPEIDWLSFRILAERYLSLPAGAPERARLEPQVSAKLRALVGKEHPHGPLGTTRQAGVGHRTARHRLPALRTTVRGTTGTGRPPAHAGRQMGPGSR